MAVLGRSRQTAQHRALEMRCASFSCIPDAAAALESKLLLLLVAPLSNSCFLAGGSPLLCVSNGTPTTFPPPPDEEDEEEEEAEDVEELVVATTWLSPRSGKFEEDGGCWTAELEDSTDMMTGNFLGIMFVVCLPIASYTKLPHNYAHWTKHTHTQKQCPSCCLSLAHSVHMALSLPCPLPAVQLVFCSVFRSGLKLSSANTSARQENFFVLFSYSD